MTENWNRADHAIVAYAQWVLRWRWLLIFAAVLVALGAGYGGTNLAFNNNYRVFFSEDNPQRQAFDEIQDTYTRNDTLLFTVSPDDGQVFTPQVLEAVIELSDQSWRLPFALRVDSVTNFQNTRSEFDDLVVSDLVIDPQNMSADEIAAARDTALSEPALLNRLISPDAAVTGVSVALQMPDAEEDNAAAQKAVSDVMRLAREMVTQFEADYPNLDLKLTGSVAMNNAFFEAAINDIKTLVPFMYLGIVIMMMLLVRCISSTIATVIVIAFSIVTGMGLAGWFGIQLTSPSASAPTVIMTLAVADCIHIIVSMFSSMRHGKNKQEAIVESLRINMQPVFLTSATTAIGFLTMNFSEVPPFRDLGNISAMGVMAAFFFSVVLLPPLLSILPCRTRPTASRTSEWIDGFADFVVSKSNPLLIGMTLISVLILAFVPANELDDEFVQYFGKTIDFRTDTDYTVKNLTGISQVHYSIPAGETSGVSDPAFLQQLDAFTEWYRQQPGVVHVNSLTDVFKRLNRVLHGDDPQWYRLPDDREMAAQYLLLYELSLPFGLDLNNQLNIDKSATQFVATTGSLSSVNLRALVADSEQWLRENAPELATTGIGISVMFSHISERNIRSMLVGALLGLVLISGLLLIALRSVRIGLLSLLPNLLPIGLAFGIWGFFVGQVNVAASIVSGMILGIIVDDTVHFLSKYLRARRERGYSPTDAVRFAFHTVGIALIVTTLILIAGFSVLSFSDFEINATMGSLTAIGIAVALIIDFLLLPPLLIKLDKGWGSATIPRKEASYVST
ncbi:MAG: MMPL family transporter [Gammaproteobacteria bacterium]|nr:MMPL family transporter [Gammaproteobacteria bacterium]